MLREKRPVLTLLQHLGEIEDDLARVSKCYITVRHSGHRGINVSVDQRIDRYH